jgi:uncharacterized protein (DUF2141 family)
MKKMKRRLFAAICLSIGMLWPLALVYAQQPVIMRFCQIQEAKGDLFVALYNQQDGFMDDDRAVFRKVIPVTRMGCMEERIVLPEGQYAVSCFHDVNGNGKLDKSFAGIPKEPYGFSGNYTAKMRGPNWKETNIPVKSGQTITIQLNSW